MKYKASLDIKAKILTTSLIVIFIAIGLGRIRYIALNPEDTGSIYLTLTVFLFFILFVVGCYLFAPQEYIINPDELIIYRPFKDFIIKLKDIKEIRIIDDSDLGSAVRTFGVGGMFGYYGKYYTSNFGPVIFYATQKRNKVLIQTYDGTLFIITPDELQLVNEIKNRIN
jgi:hypothetical protein